MRTDENLSLNFSTDSTSESLGMPAATDEHYSAINRIMTNLREALAEGGYPECKVDREVVVLQKDERVPDVVVWVSGDGETEYDRTASLPMMTVEVVHSDGGADYSTESIKDTLMRCRSLREAFLYNYSTRQWTRFWRNGSSVEHEEDDDFSQTYGIWMSEMSKIRHREMFLDANTDYEKEVRTNLTVDISINLRQRHGRLHYMRRKKTCDTLVTPPEISFWRKNTSGELHSPYMTVNITSSPRPNTHSAYFAILFRETPTLREAFLYNRILDTWVRYTRDRGGVVIVDSDYSRTLGRYMHTLLG